MSYPGGEEILGGVHVGGHRQLQPHVGDASLDQGREAGQGGIDVGLAVASRDRGSLPAIPSSIGSRPSSATASRICGWSR